MLTNADENIEELKTAYINTKAHNGEVIWENSFIVSENVNHRVTIWRNYIPKVYAQKKCKHPTQKMFINVHNRIIHNIKQ